MNDPMPDFAVDENGRLDPYRLAHKGLRIVLARLLESAGRTDFASASAREQIRRECLEVVDLLRVHARLEILFLDPLLEACPTEKARCPRLDHATLESELFTLVLALDPPAGCESRPSDARAHGHRFYLALTRLVAHYLLHMADEETRVLAALHRHVDQDLLRQMVSAAQSAMSDAEVASISAAIIEGVAPHERASVVASKQRRAPARQSRRPSAPAASGARRGV